MSAIWPLSRCKLFLLLLLAALAGVEVPLCITGIDERPILSMIEGGSSVTPAVGLKTGEFFPDSGTGETWGDAPRRPMIEGSLWWSWGIALNKWVMSFAPLLIALVATWVVAILEPHMRRVAERDQWAHLWPMETVIPRGFKFSIAFITPGISGAVVIILAAAACSLPMIQSSWWARLSTP